MYTYNTKSRHRTIGMTPAQVSSGKIEQQLLSGVYGRIKQAGRGKLKIHVLVRISKFKAQFAKGYEGNWSTELFRVRKRQLTNPITYFLEDLEGQPIVGGFYEEELKLVQSAIQDVYLVEKVLRRKVQQVLVKWLGFENRHNSWIAKNNVI